MAWILLLLAGWIAVDIVIVVILLVVVRRGRRRELDAAARPTLVPDVGPSGAASGRAGDEASVRSESRAAP